MNRFKNVYLTLLFVLLASNVWSQSVAEQVVIHDYPQLMKLYSQQGNPLAKQKAHYIFAIDVSSFMQTNIGVLKPMIAQFIQALPDGDQVTLVRKSSTEKTDYVGGVINLKVSPATRSTMINTINGPEFNVLSAGSDGFTMTEKILDAIMNPMSEGLVFVFMFTDFEYWTDQNGFDKDKVKWGELQKKFKPFLDLTKGDQSRVVMPYAFYFRDASSSRNDYRPELESIFGCKLNNPPTGDAAVLRNFFQRMETNALVYRLKFRVFQDLCKVKVASDIALSDDDEIRVSAQYSSATDFPLFSSYRCEVTDEPSCLDKAFTKADTKKLSFDAQEKLYSRNKSYSPILPCFTVLHGKMTYSILPLCGNYVKELDMLNGLDESLKLDYKKAFEFEKDLPAGWYFSHILPAWLDILILALLLAWLICLLITYLLNKFGKIYRSWNITVTEDDGENQNTFSHSFPKAKKVSVTPSAMGMPGGGNWKFDIITVDGPIYSFWKPRGYYIKRGVPMNIERKGKTKALPKDAYRVAPLKNWGSGCKLKFTSNNMNYIIKIQ